MCTGAEIALVAGGLQAGGKVMGGFDALRQSSKVAGQIADTAKENLRDTARQQKTYRGSMRTAYAKAGVTQKGTPEMALDEQMLQDEMALSVIEMDAVQNIKKVSRAGRHALYSGLIGGGSQAASMFAGK